MFGKFKKTIHKSQDSVAINDATVSDTVHSTSKKKITIKGPEIVLGMGLVLIVGGMFWFMSGGLDDGTKNNNDANHTQETTNNPDTNRSKENNITKEKKKPFVYENNIAKQTKTPVKKTDVAAKEEAPFVYAHQTDFSNENLMPPPDAYEQNISKLAKESAPLPKEAPPAKKKETTTLTVQEPTLPKIAPTEVQAKSVPKAQNSEVVTVSNVVPQAVVVPSKPQQSTVSQGSYVCSIVGAYKNMLGKEIMYYVKDKATHKYVPAYSQKNWDESGVWVKKKLVASQVDVNERMVEVAKDKWIPALEFMTCTLIQEDER